MSDQWTNRLSEYLDGELTDGERIALELRHVPRAVHDADARIIQVGPVDGRGALVRLPLHPRGRACRAQRGG